MKETLQPFLRAAENADLVVVSLGTVRPGAQPNIQEYPQFAQNSNAVMLNIDGEYAVHFPYSGLVEGDNKVFYLPGMSFLFDSESKKQLATMLGDFSKNKQLVLADYTGEYLAWKEILGSFDAVNRANTTFISGYYLDLDAVVILKEPFFNLQDNEQDTILNSVFEKRKYINHVRNKISEDDNLIEYDFKRHVMQMRKAYSGFIDCFPSIDNITFGQLNKMTHVEALHNQAQNPGNKSCVIS